MHERSVMNALMKKILSLAEAQGAKQVTKVSVKLGALSHMSPSHFQDHFTLSSKGTLAEGAHIDTEEGTDIHDPNARGVVLKSIDIAQ